MDTDAEKAEAQFEQSSRKSQDVNLPAEEQFDETEEKRILRKVDLRLITVTGILYCISLIDRANMSAANIAGMAKDLKLVGNDYNVASLVFFVTYTIFQPPSTVICRAIGPRLHISAITLLWGAVVVGMAFVNSFGALAGLRLILGTYVVCLLDQPQTITSYLVVIVTHSVNVDDRLEAGFFPSCVYLLSTWYTRFEVGKRYAVFYIIGCVATGGAGILSFGLMQLNGKAGMAGWQWIFFFEGLLTIVLAIAAYWLLVGFPDSKQPSWKFLNERELAWVVRRVNANRGDSKTPKFEWKKFFSAALDIKIW